MIKVEGSEKRDTTWLLCCYKGGYESVSATRGSACPMLDFVSGPTSVHLAGVCLQNWPPSHTLLLN